MRDLEELTAAGVPLQGVLGDMVLKTSAESADKPVAHLRPDCCAKSQPEYRPTTLSAVVPLAVCRVCEDAVPDARLTGRLHGAALLRQAMTTVARLLELAEDDLQSSSPAPAQLLSASEALRKARGELDRSLSSQGVSRIDEDAWSLTGEPEMATWLEDYRSTRLRRVEQLCGVYATHRQLEDILAVEVREGVVPRSADAATDRYVAVPQPRQALLRDNRRRIVTEILLLATPAAWLDDSGLALYRLTGPQAVAMLAAHPDAQDAGPVTDSDTEQTAHTAATLYDWRTPGAPLADPATAVTTARQVLTT